MIQVISKRDGYINVVFGLKDTPKATFIQRIPEYKLRSVWWSEPIQSLLIIL